jgi:DNA polymerase-3 subunit delta'
LRASSFAGIRGHDLLLGALDRALAEDRLASALLFHGPAGVGKLTAAVALFRGLLCLVSSPRACGDCPSCRKISATALLHPDVGLLFPQRARGEEDAADEPAEDAATGESRGGATDLQSLQEEVRRTAALKILADPTRARLRELFLSPGTGPRRALLVLAAERLGGVSGNILLKVLEEPPGGAVILLLCENPSALLPTIRSRCQSCRFSPLPRKIVADLLVERGTLPQGEANLVASLSGGRMGAALELAGDAQSYLSRRDLLSRLLVALRTEGSASAALAAARELQSEGSETVEDLSILMDILRDAMLSGAGSPPTLLTDTRPAQPGDRPAVSAREAADLLVRVEQAREDLRRYVNRQVAVEALFLDVARGAATPPDRD